MERVTGLASTQHQITQQRPDKKSVDSADKTADRPVPRPAEEIRSQAFNEMDQTRENSTQEEKATRELSTLIHEMNTRLRTLVRNEHDVDLVYEDEVEDVVVQIKERESGDLIAQWPTEEMVTMRVAFRHMIGMIVDQKS